MKCKVCNSDLTEGQAFCSYCGTKVETEPETPVEEAPAEISEPKEAPVEKTEDQYYFEMPSEEPKTEGKEPEETSAPAEETVPAVVENAEESDPTADKAALTGFIFGIISFACSFIGLPFSIIGIIKSIKGLKSKKRKGLAIPGLIISAVGIVEFFSFWTTVLTMAQELIEQFLG